MSIGRREVIATFFTALGVPGGYVFYKFLRRYKVLDLLSPPDSPPDFSSLSNSGSPVLDAWAKAWDEFSFPYDTDSPWRVKSLHYLTVTPSPTPESYEKKGQAIKDRWQYDGYFPYVPNVLKKFLERANGGVAFNGKSPIDYFAVFAGESPYSQYSRFNPIYFGTFFFLDYEKKINISFDQITFYHEAVEAAGRRVLEEQLFQDVINKSKLDLEELALDKSTIESVLQNLASDVTAMVLLFTDDQSSDNSESKTAIQQWINWRISSMIFLGKDILGIIQQTHRKDILELAETIGKEGSFTPETLYRRVLIEVLPWLPDTTQWKNWNDIIDNLNYAVGPTPIETVLTRKLKDPKSEYIVKLIQNALNSLSIDGFEHMNEWEKKVAIGNSITAWLCAYKLSPKNQIKSLISHAWFYQKKQQDLQEKNWSLPNATSTGDLAIESLLQLANAMAKKELGVDLSDPQAFNIFPEMGKDEGFHKFVEYAKDVVRKSHPFDRAYVKTVIENAKKARKKPYHYKIPRILERKISKLAINLLNRFRQDHTPA